MNREMRRLSEREERRSKKEGNSRRERKPSGGKGTSEKKQSRVARLAQFMREVRVELNRVGWPSRQQMVAFTSVTLITASVLTLFTFLMDISFRRSVLAFVRTLTS